MFPTSASKKRKNNEPVPDNDDKTKRVRQNVLPTEENSKDIMRSERLREIIKQEFKHEIRLKETQLEHIDDRLEEAHTILNRLRYAIVAEYYKKQEQPQLMFEATKAMQNTATSVQSNNDLQIAMHPSLKKIIGKRPTNLEDIMKVCPKRAAAENAKHGLLTKTSAKRKDERLREKAIREQGIAIDNTRTKQESTNLKQESISNDISKLSRLETSNPHTLNSGRIGNKSKYLFVVGNTSKYISNADSQIIGNVSLTHKWLVYVQTKDTDVPISKYIKKVRFFLHPSYRPNDIIDVHAPPFQVARRGWGEFPMRIQLFFHEKYMQKPVQLVHRVVLDTSKSGRHTLGAETVMEVWLRDFSTSSERHAKNEKTNTLLKNVACSPSVTSSSPTKSLMLTSPTKKSRTISFASMKEPFDDHFMDFLNKIEETRTSICADIEKIQPTVVVNETLEPQLANVHRSPITIKNEPNSPSKRTPTQQSPYRTRSTSANAQNMILTRNTLPKTIKDANTKLQVITNQAETTKTNLAEEVKKKAQVEKPNESSSMKNSTEFISKTNNSRISISNNTKKMFVPAPSGKVFSNVSGTVILPVTKPQQKIQQLNPNQTTNTTLNTLSAKSVFQKKIVQVIDAQGKIKTVQMLVASSKAFPTNVSTPASATKSSTNESGPVENAVPGNVSTKPLITHLVRTKPIIIKPTITSSNIVADSAAIAITTTTAPTTRNEICVNKPVMAHNSNAVSTTAGSSSSTKNLVFQKEGKLYIIDPMQMKLKQQQKNQISLLKPQIKLQPQTQIQQQQQQLQNNIIATIATDHDYVPLVVQKLQTKHTEMPNSSPITTNTTATSLLRAPSLYLGMQNNRPNLFKTQDLLRIRQIQFEKRFFRIKFTSMRSAVEYLLRRLPLNVFDKDSPAATFPFACVAPQEFRNLPAFKQRSCEWLRAKFITKLLRNLPSLQQLDTSKEDTFWSTREIVTFARCFSYTPPIKSLCAAKTTSTTPITVPGFKEHISTIIKKEMQNEQLQGEYDSLSSVNGMQQWLERMQQQLQQKQELLIEDSEIIIIDDENSAGNENVNQCLDSKEKSSTKDKVTKRIYGSPQKFESTNSQVSFLPPLSRLETASQFVGEICKDFSIRLHPEEIVPGIVHPAAQTLLAHVLKVFADRLMRQAVAHQINQSQEQNHSITDVSFSNTVDRCITVKDLRKAIVDTNELDFLSNRHLGVSANQIKHE